MFSSLNALVSRSSNSQYLARIEHYALHQPGIPELYAACGQIKVTGSGTAQVAATATGPGQPETVSIPGYVTRSGMCFYLSRSW